MIFPLMRKQTALNEWGLIDTHTLTLYYTCINYLYTHTHTGTHTHTHTRRVRASPLEERRKISHLCARRARLEHDCRHQSEQTEGRNIQDYHRVVKQTKPPTIRRCTHNFAALTESLKTSS